MKRFFPSGELVADRGPVSISPMKAGWTYSGLDIVELGTGEAVEIGFPDRETVVFPLRGGCHVSDGVTGFDLGERQSVWTAPPDAVYFGVGATLRVDSNTGGTFAVASALADQARPARFFPAAAMSIDVRGAGQATRQINGVVSADVEGPQRLIVVEVLAPGGNWSSYPPHKHDEWTDDEVPVEEIYYFEIRGEHGFGIHRTYTTDGEIDDTLTVRSGDVYLVPRGYHGPCVAAPGYDMYYLNVMAGPDPQRRWMICIDPAHRWVVGEWELLDADPRVPLY